MKVFISWSGEKSKQAAVLLKEWIPGVIQEIKDIWVSSKDIAAGDNWSTSIGKELEGRDFGIICVTKENQRRTWLNFEAGAMSKLVGNAAPLLIDFESVADLDQGPISQLQVTAADRDGMLKLMQDMNAKVDSPLTDTVLKRAFDYNYPEFQTKIDAIRLINAAVPVETRKEAQKIDDILTLVRSLSRELPSIDERLTQIEQIFPTRLREDAELARELENYHEEVMKQLQKVSNMVDDRDLAIKSVTWRGRDRLLITPSEEAEISTVEEIARRLAAHFPKLLVSVRGSESYGSPTRRQMD